VDLSGLTNSVTAILGLFVHCRVPVGVIENDSVGAGKVNPQPSASGARDKAEDAIVQVESIDHALPHLDLCRPIQSNVAVTMDIQKLLENI
jgi:hypothetical protein